MTATPAYLSFFKIYRSETTRELLRDPNAFTLLTQIALRAKRTDDLSIYNLRPGQALIGDHKNCGLSMREYRTAKERLEKYRLATFQATNKGTIATLTDSRVFDVNIEQDDNQNDKTKTNQRQSNDKPETTIKKGNKGKNEKNSVRGQTTGLPDHRIDYSKTELPEVKDYSDIYSHDPILMAMAITGERSKQGWGHWVKVLNNGRVALGVERAERLFRSCLKELFGEVKQGECDKPGAVLNVKLKTVFGEP